MPTHAQRIQAVFLAAAEVADPADRAKFLDGACDGDRDLRSRVEALLSAHDQPDSFLDQPAVAPHDTDPLATRTIGCAGGAATDDEALTFLAPGTRADSLGRIGHYEVLQVLGKGGFGIVFRAFDEMLQRVVALKVMAPQLAATSPARKRFLREARSSAQVRHENVVQVYEVADQPLPYLVMEFIPGETLQQKLDRVGPLDVPETLRIGRQIAEGLAAAHAMDLIHRDIKPANVILEGGHQKVKITDFGLARAADDASVTQSGIIAGTPMYMAPEQAQGQTLDQRADLFGLGSVLYQMVSGRPPFRANTTVAVLKRVAEDKPRAIREIIPETPQWLCDIIAKLHAKNPDERYQSAREVADVLADCETQLRTNARLKDFSRIPRSKPPRSRPRPRLRRRRWAAAGAVLLLLLVGLGFTEATGVTDVRGTVIRLFTSEGTLVVEVDDPGVSVQIDGSDIVISGAGVKEIRLKPGNYTVEARKDGKVVNRELATVTKDGKQIVRISLESAPVPKIDAEKKDPDHRAAEYLLSNGGRVNLNGQDQELKAAAELPRQAFRLTGVVLWNADGNQVTVTDAGLAALKDCKDVTHIAAFRAPLSDAGLAHFKNCKNLTYLSLEGPCAVTDAGLAAFKDCKHLTFLRLTGMPLTGTGLVHFKDCKNLKSAYLHATQVSDTGLIHLMDCKNLTDLSLLGTQVGDAGLAHLAGLTALTGLDLRESRVTAKGALELAKALPMCRIHWDGGVLGPTTSLDSDRRAAEVSGKRP